MLMRVETSEEHGHLWQPKQSAGYWSSPDREEEIFPGREQRNANLMFSSSEEEATMKRVEKHMPKYNKRRRLVLKRKAEKRKEIMNKIAEARNGDMETETSCRGCAPQLMLQHPASGLHKKFQKAVFDYLDYMSLGQ